MSFAWFIYTVALMVVVTTACATSVVSWLLSNRRDSLAAATGFFAYVLDTAVILFDEYARMKPLGEEYLTVGLTHPIFQVLLNAVLVGSLWAWVVLRLGSSFGVRRVLPVVGGLLVVGALLAPVGSATGPVRTFAYWGFRDVSIIGAFAAMLWRYVSSQQESERADLARLRRPLSVALVLSVAMLAEDAANILYVRPDLTVGWISEFLWHLTERNLSENILVLWLAGLSIRTTHDTMRVFARHPAHDEERLSDERIRPDFEVRLLAYADTHGLSKREREVLSLVLQGKDAQNVASELVISPGTVKAHLSRIYRKAEVKTRQELLDSFWRG